jgi:AcrR family transcriptional regulator
MSTPAPGLRERKRVALRRRIQQEALRLFAEHGFERTTVEQIADAADTSTTTFYRYFPAKQDVILRNDLVAGNEAELAGIEAELIGRPAGESLATVIRAFAHAMVGFAEADEAFHLARLRLVTLVPDLAAHHVRDEILMVTLLRRVVAARTGRPVDDLDLELLCGATTAAVLTATRRWAAQDGRPPLAELVDRAMDVLVPMIAATGLTPRRDRSK